MRTPALDFRKILIAYIDLVGEEEGINFLPSSHLPGLTDREIGALHRAAAESQCVDWHKRELLATADRLDPQDG